MSAHIFLSPHFDDAIGSCGGEIWRLRRAGERVEVLTIFGGDAVLPLSDDAVRFHAAGAFDGVAVRRAEDRRACARLDCASRHLDFPDAIYRSGDDAPSPRQIAERIAAMLPGGSATVYAPMAIGRHADHLLTRDAALELVSSGHEVIFYADFYYTAFARPRVKRALEPWRRAIGMRAFVAKLMAFACYRSQMAAMFDGTARTCRHFWRHGRSEWLASASDFRATLATELEP